MLLSIEEFFVSTEHRHPQHREAQPPASEKLVLWSSERYFSKEPAAAEQLRQDLTSFFDEYSFLRAAVTYPYGPSGMQQGYTEPISAVTARFLERIKNEKRPTARAEAELATSKYVVAWMNSHDHEKLPERLITISPRGTKEELYPGLNTKNYVFINVFEKSETGFVLKQFRSYDTNEHLPTVQASLAALSGQKNALEYLPTAAQQQPDHRTITTLVHVPDSVPFSQIEAVLYAQKKHWPVDIDRELPQVPSTARVTELQRTTEYCMQLYHELAATTLTTKEKHSQYTELITLVRAALLKWTEDHATNYHTAESPRHYHLDLDLITASWKARIKQKSGSTLAREDVAALEKMKLITQLNPLLPLEKAASWAHCIVGTPQLQLSNLALPGVANSAQFLEYHKLIGNLSTAEKSSLTETLRSYIQLNIGGEVWFVPESYLAAPGCSYSTELQCAIGPCGIPLKDDPLAYTKNEYDALLAALSDSPEAAFENFSAETQAYLGSIATWLIQELFVSSASLERILIGDVFKREEVTLQVLLPLRSFLMHSHNPFAQVYWYILSLHEADDTTMLKKLAQLQHAPKEQSVQTGEEVVLFSAHNFV